MASQKVHNVSYLAHVTLDLSQATTKAVILPKGAQVVQVSLEVTEPSDSGAKLDLGFEGSVDVIANDINIEQVGVNICNVALEPKQNLELLATSTGTTKGKAILRVLYFLPSVISVEIH